MESAFVGIARELALLLPAMDKPDMHWVKSVLAFEREVRVTTNVESHLPLTPLSIHILLSLVDEERHGYGIMKEIERLTQGLATSATGPVYLAAQRLLETGLIEESENRPAPEFDDQRRRYYRLTELGWEVARAEVDRMARLVQVAFDKGLAKGSLTITPTHD